MNEDIAQQNINDIDPCSICLEDIITDAIMTMPCEHYFHAKCHSSWTKTQKTCPNCVAKIDDIIKFDNNAWDDWDRKKDQTEFETEFSCYTDNQLQCIVIQEIKQMVQKTKNDHKTQWQTVCIKDLDGNKNFVDLPLYWSFYEIKSAMTLFCKISINDLCIIINGVPISDILTLKDYIKDTKEPITLHLIRMIY